MEEEQTKGNKDLSICIVGLGYVGLPLSMLFLKKGFHVFGIDIDQNKIDKLRRGFSYLSDVPNKEIEVGISTNHFTVDSNYQLIEKADIIIVCTPTPLTVRRKPDLSFLQDAGKELSKWIKKGQLIILESSTYPGTTREFMKPILESGGLVVGKDIYLSFSPERIDPGNKDYSLEKIPKVIGGITEECTRRTYEIYSLVFDKVISVSSPESAEFAKLVENSYRFINISFINEIAMICQTMNVNIWEVIAAANTKPYGFQSFYPGPGIGGHCIPIDPLYLNWKAKQYNVVSQFIQIADEINRHMPKYIVKQIQQLLRFRLRRANILIYGVTYKRDIEDTRESSAFDIIRLLRNEGANVCYYDPLVPQLFLDNRRLTSVDLTDELLSTFDCIVIHTNHTGMNLQLILDNARLVFDTRNATEGMNGKAKIVRLGGGGK